MRLVGSGQKQSFNISLAINRFVPALVGRLLGADEEPSAQKQRVAAYSAVRQIRPAAAPAYGNDSG
jgi:hypothetical protein